MNEENRVRFPKGKHTNALSKNLYFTVIVCWKNARTLYATGRPE